MQKPDARRKNLLRKGSFLFALFLFQTFRFPDAKAFEIQPVIECSFQTHGSS